MKHRLYNFSLHQLLSKMETRSPRGTGFNAGLVLFSSALAAKQSVANESKASYFIPQSDLVAFAVEQKNGEFWLKLINGNWAKVPKESTFFLEGGVVAASQDWLIKNAPFLVSNPKTQNGDYVAFEICIQQVGSARQSVLTFLQSNIPGIEEAKLIPGGAIAIELLDGSSIALYPQHFSVFEDKIIISREWLESNLPSVAAKVGKDFSFPSLVGCFSQELPKQYSNKKFVEIENVKSLISYEGAGFEITLESGEVLLVQGYGVELKGDKVFLNKQVLEEISQRPKVWADVHDSADGAGGGGADLQCIRFHPSLRNL